MAATGKDKKNQVKVRPGRRFALEFECPRDQTVCFTVSKEEKQAIDRLAGQLRRTRSSFLTRIVVSFLDDAEAGKAVNMDALLTEYVEIVSNLEDDNESE